MSKRRTPLLLSLVLVALIAALVVAVLWARPLLALRDLKHALETRNEQQVAATVDFVALKRNVSVYVDNKIEKDNAHKFLGGLRTAVTQPLAENKIAALASPSGLIHLACDTQPDGSIDDSPKPPGTPCKLNADLHSPHYLDNGDFEVQAKRPTQGDMGMILGRGDDGRWRLVGLTGSGPVAK